jgi:hypothetical protein
MPGHRGREEQEAGEWELPSPSSRNLERHLPQHPPSDDPVVPYASKASGLQVDSASLSSLKTTSIESWLASATIADPFRAQHPHGLEGSRSHAPFPAQQVPAEPATSSYQPSHAQPRQALSTTSSHAPFPAQHLHAPEATSSDGPFQVLPLHIQHAAPSTGPFQVQPLRSQHDKDALREYSKKGPCMPLLLPCGHHVSLKGQEALVAAARRVGCLPVCHVCSEPFEQADVVTHQLLRCLVVPSRGRGGSSSSCSSSSSNSGSCNSSKEEKIVCQLPRVLVEAAMSLQRERGALPAALPAAFQHSDRTSLHHVDVANSSLAVKCFKDVHKRHHACAALWQLSMMAVLQQAGDAARDAAVAVLFWIYRGTEVLVAMPRYLKSFLDVGHESRTAEGVGVAAEQAMGLTLLLSQALLALHTCGDNMAGISGTVQGLVHGFVHPSNVLLSGKSDRVCLCGFGNSALVWAAKCDVLAPNQIVDDSEWSPPEVVLAAETDEKSAGRALSYKADVWGVALMLCFLISGMYSFPTQAATHELHTIRCLCTCLSILIWIP